MHITKESCIAVGGVCPNRASVPARVFGGHYDGAIARHCNRCTDRVVECLSQKVSSGLRQLVSTRVESIDTQTITQKNQQPDQRRLPDLAAEEFSLQDVPTT